MLSPLKISLSPESVTTSVDALGLDYKKTEPQAGEKTHHQGDLTDSTYMPVSKMIKYLTFCLFVLFATPAVHALSIDPYPAYDSNVKDWPNNATLVGSEGNWVRVNTQYPSAVKYKIKIIVRPYHQSQGVALYHADVSCTVSYALTCGGFTFPETTKNNPPDAATMQRFVQHILLSRLVMLKSSGNGTGSVTACEATLQYADQNSSGLYQASCDNGIPQPVYCNISGDTEYNYGVQPLGTISKTLSHPWVIACTAPTTVTISTQAKIIATQSEGYSLETKLFVDYQGTTERRIQVNGYALAKIISSLNSTAQESGVYTGSGIVRIQWD